jgi:hypothetical protein
MARSARVVTVVETVAELLALTGSIVLVVTDTVFEKGFGHA